MSTDQKRSAKARPPSKTGARGHDRIAAMAARQVRLQGAIIMTVFFVSLALLQVPRVPVIVHAMVLWVLVAALLASLIVFSRRSARELATLYQRTITEMEQELHDLTFRETTSTILDKLTGVYTFEYLHSRLREEVERARRYQRPVTLILVDLAQFHLVNQQYGRTMGNQILRRFAQGVLRTAVRGSDVLARYGGDEFAILLPETDAEQAMAVARRMIDAASRGTILPEGQRLNLPITLGLACYPAQGTTPEDLTHAATQALLQSKRERALASQVKEQV